ncbi:MAG: HEAT repeat domain-containing protein, partial [Deltaproteobacteria bacterium]|nr:HEAT repeat domain-containing protein [Deltaproteobacteria bacterium]
MPVEELIQAARAGDADAAAELVGRMGRPWNDETRSDAYKAVLSLPDDLVEVPVREACRSQDPVFREHALAVAGNRGWPWAFGEAVAALEDRSFPRRYVGAWVLGELGRPEAAPVLAAALTQGGDVAREATRALVKLGPGAVLAIQQAFSRLPPAGR